MTEFSCNVFPKVTNSDNFAKQTINDELFVTNITAK